MRTRSQPSATRPGYRLATEDDKGVLFTIVLGPDGSSAAMTAAELRQTLAGVPDDALVALFANTGDDARLLHGVEAGLTTTDVSIQPEPAQGLPVITLLSDR